MVQFRAYMQNSKSHNRLQLHFQVERSNLPCFTLDIHPTCLITDPPWSFHYSWVVNAADAFLPPTATVNNFGLGSCTAPDWFAPFDGVTSSYGKA